MNAALNRIVLKIKRSLKKRQTRIIEQKEWEGAKAADYESHGTTLCRIADAAKCDWLMEASTGDVRFFELK